MRQRPGTPRPPLPLAARPGPPGRGAAAGGARAPAAQHERQPGRQLAQHARAGRARRPRRVAGLGPAAAARSVPCRAALPRALWVGAGVPGGAGAGPRWRQGGRGQRRGVGRGCSVQHWYRRAPLACNPPAHPVALVVAAAMPFRHTLQGAPMPHGASAPPESARRHAMHTPHPTCLLHVGCYSGLLRALPTSLGCKKPRKGRA